MANADTPRGFHAVRLLDGSPYTGGGKPYYVGSGDTVALFRGDPVALTGTANTAEVNVVGFGKFPAGTLPVVARATAGSTGNILGIVASVAATTRDSLTYRAASTARVVFVHDNPEIVFEAQEDSVSATLAATNVGQNVDFIAGTGSTSTGLSGAELDSNTAGTAATKQFRILRLVNREDNAIGTNAKWEVIINPARHQLAIGTGV